MKLRTKFILLVFILHATLLVLSYYVFRENKPLFIGAEVVVILSLLLSRNLYAGLIRPLQTLVSGIESIRERDFNVRFLPTGKYETDRLIGVYNEMMDQLKAERTRQEEQHFFLEKLIHTSPTGIFVLDFEDKVYQVNPKGLEILGLQEADIKGRTLDVVSHPLAGEIGRIATGESGVVGINGIESYKLTKSHFIDRGFVRHFVMVEEVTAAVMAAEKSAYGKVIRMMAHEVNNTVGPVNSILQSVLGSFNARGTRGEGGEGDGAGGDALIDALQVALDRNDHLNQFMRNFAEVVKIPHPERKTLDLIPMVRDVIQLMQFRRNNKELHLQYEESENLPFMILADAHQTEQVLINVIKNGLEAIDEGGKVTIALYRNPKRIIIRDTGRGIPPELEEFLFTPFFSTKKEGQGIGLTVAREILMGHGFGFGLKTVRPGLTEFTITFE